MTLEEIKNIPTDKAAMYARVVVDFRLQKEDPNCVQIKAGVT